MHNTVLYKTLNLYHYYKLASLQYSSYRLDERVSLWAHERADVSKMVKNLVLCLHWRNDKEIGQTTYQTRIATITKSDAGFSALKGSTSFPHRAFPNRESCVPAPCASAPYHAESKPQTHVNAYATKNLLFLSRCSGSETDVEAIPAGRAYTGIRSVIHHTTPALPPNACLYFIKILVDY